MAALEMMGAQVEIMSCAMSADVLAAVVGKTVDGAVLPIENSLHGSVADIMTCCCDNPVRVEREGPASDTV